MEKYRINANVKKNRLYLILKGFFTDEEVHKAAELTISEIDKLKPGFSIINDISNFKPASPAGAEEIKRCQIYASEHGVKRIVRVVGKDAVASAITAMQFSRTQQQAGYTADIAATVEDAEKLLGD